MGHSKIEIKRIENSRRHWTARLDFWPFVTLYALWLLLAVPALDFTDALVIFGVLSASHILAFLFTAWSVDFRAFVGHSKVNDIHATNACKVISAKFLGWKEIVPLCKQKTVASSSASGETEEIYFDFRKQRFFYSAEKDNFFKLRYPTKDLFGHFIKGSGYGTEAKINTAMDKWGRNMWEDPKMGQQVGGPEDVAVHLDNQEFHTGSLRRSTTRMCLLSVGANDPPRYSAGIHGAIPSMLDTEINSTVYTTSINILSTCQIISMCYLNV